MNSLLSIGIGAIIGISVAIVVVIAITVAVVVVFPIKAWWKARVSGTPIKMTKLLAMKMRGINLSVVIVDYITATKSGLNIDVSLLETHIMAGGNIDKVVKALVSAKNAGLNLNAQMAMALDLAGRDIYEVVQNCIVPKVIETKEVSALAKDSVEVKAKAHITILANINRIIGGADENTILVRVSEALSSTIGSAVSHGAVLENPDVISDAIMAKGLDSGTAYEIMSIDIFELSVGKDYDMQRKMEQAELDKKHTQIKMEERRLAAVALEQENKAKIEEAKIKAVEADIEVPKALIKALNEGKISPVEYYDIQNLQADTKLRNILSSANENKQSKEDPLEVKPKPRRNPFNF